jgi:hypothetical protein
MSAPKPQPLYRVLMRNVIAETLDEFCKRNRKRNRKKNRKKNRNRPPGTQTRVGKRRTILQLEKKASGAYSCIPPTPRHATLPAAGLLTHPPCISPHHEAIEPPSTSRKCDSRFSNWRKGQGDSPYRYLAKPRHLPHHHHVLKGPQIACFSDKRRDLAGQAARLGLYIGCRRRQGGVQLWPACG